MKVLTISSLPPAAGKPSDSGSPDHHGRRKQRADKFMVWQSQLIHFNVSVFDIFSISLTLNVNDGIGFVMLTSNNFTTKGPKLQILLLNSVIIQKQEKSAISPLPASEPC